VRLDWFRMNAAEVRVTRSANFVARDSVAGEEFPQQPCGRPVHGIRNEAEVRFAEALPIDQFLNRLQIRGDWLERLNQFLTRRQKRDTGCHDAGKFAFNLPNDGR